MREVCFRPTCDEKWSVKRYVADRYATIINGADCKFTAMLLTIENEVFA